MAGWLAGRAESFGSNDHAVSPSRCCESCFEELVRMAVMVVVCAGNWARLRNDSQGPYAGRQELFKRPAQSAPSADSSKSLADRTTCAPPSHGSTLNSNGTGMRFDVLQKSRIFSPKQEKRKAAKLTTAIDGSESSPLSTISTCPYFLAKTFGADHGLASLVFTFALKLLAHAGRAPELTTAVIWIQQHGVWVEI